VFDPINQLMKVKSTQLRRRTVCGRGN